MDTRAASYTTNDAMAGFGDLGLQWVFAMCHVVDFGDAWSTSLRAFSHPESGSVSSIDACCDGHRTDGATRRTWDRRGNQPCTKAGLSTPLSTTVAASNEPQARAGRIARPCPARCRQNGVLWNLCGDGLIITLVWGLSDEA